MFSIPRVNVVESDTGFTVEILGRTGIKYSEVKKEMFVESEILMTETPTVAIWKDWITAWEPPYDTENITEAKRGEIIKNICAALQWRNVKVKIS